MSIQRRIYEQNLGVNEAVKVGDTVHIGHGTKGGTGVTGKVTKVSGGMVHIQNDKGDTFKGPVDRVTVKEAVKPALRAGVDYKPSTPSDRAKNIMKGEADKAAKMRSTPDTSAAGRAAQRMIDARKATQAGLKAKQQNQESVEMEEGAEYRAQHFGGMKAVHNSPSFKRYQARLKAEREARWAKQAAEQPKTTDKAPKPKSKELPKDMRIEAIKYDSSERERREREDIAALHKKGDKEGIARIMRARAKEKKRIGEAIKYDSAGDSTGTVTGKGKRDRGPGGEVMVQYKGSETYPKGAKLPIGARDMGRLLRTARQSGTTPYDSRNLRNPRITKDHVEFDEGKLVDRVMRKRKEMKNKGTIPGSEGY